jgi:hypothetical protein
MSASSTNRGKVIAFPFCAPASAHRSQWRGRYPKGVSSIVIARRDAERRARSVAQIDREISELESTVSLALEYLNAVRGQLELCRQNRRSLDFKLK